MTENNNPTKLSAKYFKLQKIIELCENFRAHDDNDNNICSCSYDDQYEISVAICKKKISSWRLFIALIYFVSCRNIWLKSLFTHCSQWDKPQLWVGIPNHLFRSHDRLQR